MPLVQSLVTAEVPDWIYRPYDLGDTLLSRFFGNVPIYNDDGSVDRHVYGAMPGKSYVITGLPGCGKTTFCFGMMDRLQKCTDTRSVFVSCEMPVSSLRTMFGPRDIDVCDDTDVESIMEIMPDYDVVFVDSIQTVTSAGQSMSPASQVQAVVDMASAAEESGTVLIMVCQVTKAGDFAGPSGLKHAVDALFTLQRPDKIDTTRIIVPDKHRYGASGLQAAMEVGFDDNMLCLSPVISGGA